MDPVDEALSALRNLDHPIFASHGPMAVEALEALGRADHAPAWAERYIADQELAPLPGPSGDATALRLGDRARRADWIARIEAELDETPWRDVVGRHLPTLLPAMACEAAHGLIRVSHAVRSLARRESPQRLAELADALGYWASSFETLPARPGSGRTGLASKAIEMVPVVPVANQAYEGSIDARLRALRDLPGFRESVAALAPGDDAVAFANDLALVSAQLYLANAPRTRVIDFIHAVDGVAAIRELLPFLDTPTTAEALFYGWQTVAALHASAGGGESVSPAGASPSDFPELVERAIANGGPHAIKFAQACVAEHGIQADPLFPAALRDAVGRMEELKEKLGFVI